MQGPTSFWTIIFCCPLCNTTTDNLNNSSFFKTLDGVRGGAEYGA